MVCRLYTDAVRFVQRPGGPGLLVRARQAELDVPPHRGWAPYVHGGLVVEESPGRDERPAGTGDMA